MKPAPHPGPRYLQFPFDRATRFSGLFILAVGAGLLVHRATSDGLSANWTLAEWVPCALIVVGALSALWNNHCRIDRLARTVTWCRGLWPVRIHRVFGFDQIERLDVTLRNRGEGEYVYSLQAVTRRGDAIGLQEATCPIIGSWKPTNPFDLGRNLAAEIGCPFLPTAQEPNSPVPW